MDRKRMIEVLKMNRDLAMFEPTTGECRPTNELNAESAEALNMAIEALEQMNQTVDIDDCISRQAAIDVLDVLCQEHRYRIPGKRETYSEYNEAWQDALDRAEGAIGNLPSAQPNHNAEVSKMEIVCCENCEHWDTSWETVCGSHYCHVIDMGTEKNFFCKYGAEKRGEADAETH